MGILKANLRFSTIFKLSNRKIYIQNLRLKDTLQAERNAPHNEKSLKPGSVVVNHVGLWILQPRFESVPGYTHYVSKLILRPEADNSFSCFLYFITSGAQMVRIPSCSSGQGRSKPLLYFVFILNI